MSVLPVVVVGLTVAGTGLLLAMAVGLRALLVSSRPGSFPTWILHADGPRWVRGVSAYGRTELRWHRLWDVPFRAPIVLPRQEIDLAEVPTAWLGSDLVTVKLQTRESEYSVALSPGDASGLVAWLDSAAPGQ